MDQELLRLPIENRRTAQKKDGVWTQRISPGQKSSSRTLRQISSSAHGEGSVCLDLGIGGLLNIVLQLNNMNMKTKYQFPEESGYLDKLKLAG